MKSSDTNDWGSHLQPSDRQILIRTAQNIAPLVQNQKKMRRFRARLTEFAAKWKAHRTAHEAEQEGKWQPSMGIPENPLGVIWPYAYIQQQPGHFPNYPKDVPTILGDYVILGVIHVTAFSFHLSGSATHAYLMSWRKKYGSTLSLVDAMKAGGSTHDPVHRRSRNIQSRRIDFPDAWTV